MCASLVFQVHQAHTSGQIRIIFHLHLDFPEIAGVSFPFQKTLPFGGANRGPCKWVRDEI